MHIHAEQQGVFQGQHFTMIHLFSVLFFLRDYYVCVLGARSPSANLVLHFMPLSLMTH